MRLYGRFQSQTGSQALSDYLSARAARRTLKSFNPKREVRPSQTVISTYFSSQITLFQSQTGSQALSDDKLCICRNGRSGSFNPKREVRPSQTASARRVSGCSFLSFNPKREVRPSQTPTASMLDCVLGKLVSIPNGKSGPLRRR